MPPRTTGGNRSADFVPVRGDQVKPTQPDAPRTLQVQRTSTGRDLSGPVVVRRAFDSPRVDGQGIPQPSASRPTRAETTPSSGAVGGARAPERSVERVDRPARVPDFRPAERPVTPSRSGESRGERDRSAPTGTVVAPEREQRYSAPSRSETPRRAEPPAGSRVERPATPSRSVERQESRPTPPPPPPPPPPSASRPERSAPATPEHSAPAPTRKPDGQ